MPSPQERLTETSSTVSSSPRPAETPLPSAGSRDRIRESVRGLSYQEGARRLSPGGDASRAPAAPPAQEPAAPEGPTLSPQAYEAALGRLLGGKLFDLVRTQTSPEQIAAHSRKVVDALMGAASGLARDDASLSDADRRAIQDALQQTLGPALKAEAEAYLASEEGRRLAAQVQGWAVEHPWMVVGAAILAAAGAVAANVEVPRLGGEKSLSLGSGEGAPKITGGAGVRLGHIRELAFQAIDARLALEAGRFSAEAKVEHRKDQGTTGQVSARYGTEQASVSTVAKIDRQGLLSASAGARVRTDQGEASLSVGKERDRPGSVDATVQWADGQQRRLEGAARVDQSGAWSVRLSQEITKDAWTRMDALSLSNQGASSATTVTARGTHGQVSGGVETTGAGQSGFVEGKGAWGGLTVSGRLEGGGAEGPRASGETRWDLGDLTARLSARLGRGEDAVGGEVEQRLGPYTAGIRAEYGLIDDRLLSVGVHFGYRDPKEFEAFLLEFRRTRAGDVPLDEFKVTVEHTLGEYLLRAQNTTTWKNGALSSGVGSLMVAKPLDQNWKVIAGVSGGYGPDKTVGIRPEVGVQYKNIPVTIGYDLNQKAVGIRITLPFGR